MSIKHSDVERYRTETSVFPVAWEHPGSRVLTTLWQRALVALSLGLGLGGVALADEASRRGQPYRTASIPFWLGLLLIFVPLSFRALAPRIDRRERLALVVILGVALYLVKVIAFPHDFTFVDEYVHVRNTQDMLRTHHLFALNPLLPTAAYYPGLGALTAGLVQLTGLSIFAAGLLVIGVARVLLCAFLYLVAERVTGSSRGAAAATLLYAANPMFLFWTASFSYENLALPFGAFGVWWIMVTRRSGSSLALGAAAVVVSAVTITHHVVGFALATLLACWWITERLDRYSPTDARRRVGLMALLAGGSTLIWFFVVAKPAPAYLLSNNLVPAIRQTGSLLIGNVEPRKLYTSGGVEAPVWETAAGFAAIAIVLLALPAALHRAWRSSPVSMGVALLVAFAYPLTLVPRLAPSGVAISGRSSEYVFVGLGCVIGILVVSPTQTGRPYRFARSITMGRPSTRAVIATALGAVVLIGNVTIGTAFYQRLPEARHPRGVPWSVQPDVIAASKWARAHLGINRRFGADAIDSGALATYGGQYPLDGNRLWPIFFPRSMNSAVAEHIRSAKLRYVLVDWAMTRGIAPSPGYFFSPQEPGAGEYLQAFPRAGLEKFSSAPCTKLIYRSGAIRIYDVSQIGTGVCEALLGGAAGRS